MNREYYITIDIGNTSTTSAITLNGDIKYHFQFASDKTLTKSQFSEIFRDKLRDYPYKSITHSIISSVVPELTDTISSAIEDILNIKPIALTHKTPIGLEIKYSNTSEIGPDRLANALALKTLYPLPTIGVDLGTATTFDVLSAKGEYLGGVIAPGLETSAHNLFKRASLLEPTDIKPPESIIGKSTDEAIRAGILYQSAKSIDGIVREIEGELNEKATVVLTGGYAGMVASLSEVVDEVDRHITHRGLIIALDILTKKTVNY